MTFLYSCRHSGDQYRITKLNEHFEVEGNSSYLCTLSECDCPAGVRPMCRHREMLPKFIHRKAIGTEWMYDFDRGGWVQGPQEDEPTPMPPILEGWGEIEPEAIGQEVRINFVGTGYVQPPDTTAPAKWRRF